MNIEKALEIVEQGIHNYTAISILSDFEYSKNKNYNKYTKAFKVIKDYIGNVEEMKMFRKRKGEKNDY